MIVTKEQSEIVDFAKKNKVIVALGFFDGVHRGHQALLKRCLKIAQKQKGAPCVLLIEPHPIQVLKGPEHFLYLNTLSQRIDLIQKQGPFNIFIVPFTRSFADLSPMAFVQQYLIDMLHVHGVVAGFNYSFGKQGAGHGQDLKEYGLQFGFQVEQVSPVTYQQEIVSSTLIRQFIEAGQLEKAADYLGHPHIYAGNVVNGNRLGTALGFPTANIQLAKQILWPGYGVYAGWIRDEKANMHQAVINVGIRPSITQDDKAPSFEAHLLNYSGNLYNTKLQMILSNRLRQEQTFADLEDLKQQVARDKAAALAELAGLQKKYAGRNQNWEDVFSCPGDFIFSEAH
jgi:riboflavin kinase/FMN adenylyltransferase